MQTSTRKFFNRIETSKNLPTLPHILLKLIEACNMEQNTIKDISRIITNDVSLSARLMRLVNSVYYGLPNRVVSINHALVLLGTNTVKNIAVSASVYQTFDHAKDSSLFRLKPFWWHSIMCATLSKLIAGKTSYPAPDEAFLSGLLHDIGKLVLWVNFPKKYAEILQSYRDKPDLLLAGETRLGATHCEVGAWMINRWNLQSFMADAVRYHHEQVHRVLDALPLVKIIFVSNALCSEATEGTDTGFKTANEILGFARPDVEELISLAREQTKEVAESLDIEVEPPDASALEQDAVKQEDLVRAVRDISLLQGTLQNLLEAHDEESILKVVKQGLQVLFDVHNVLFFLYDQERDALVGKAGIEPGQDVLIKELVIPIQRNKSLLTKSLSQGTPLDSFGRLTKTDLSIMDDQLVRFLGKDGMLCLPMVSRGAKVGVMVLGIDNQHIGCLRDQVKLSTMLAGQAALALTADHLRQGETNRLRDVIKNIQEVLDKEKSHG
ncbi:MAG: HDOD domain-containing protein [Desulfobacteria bacterium]